MGSPVAKLVTFEGRQPGQQVWTWCPGCNSIHPFTVAAPLGPKGEQLNSGITWSWDGNLERPTFSPSLICHNSIHLCAGEHDPLPCQDYMCERSAHSVGALIDGRVVWWLKEGFPENAERVYGHAQPHSREPAWGSCHSFLRNGQWEFLNDSAHHLAGKTVPMVPLPATYV